MAIISGCLLGPNALSEQSYAGDVTVANLQRCFKDLEGDTVGDVRDAARNTGNRARNAAESAGDSARNAAHSAGDSTHHACRDARDAARSTGNSARRQAAMLAIACAAQAALTMATATTTLMMAATTTRRTWRARSGALSRPSGSARLAMRTSPALAVSICLTDILSYCATARQYIQLLANICAVDCT
eukprot:13948-Heterococcus_DN1.PRE.9